MVAEGAPATEHLGATQLGTTAPLSNNAKITSTSSDKFDECGFDVFLTDLVDKRKSQIKLSLITAGIMR